MPNLADVLALHLRTELLAETQRHALDPHRRVDGCAAIDVFGYRSSTGHPMPAQTWGWLLHATSTLIVVLVERERRPATRRLWTAGLLSKSGMNEAGLAIGRNFLSTERDAERSGVSYHALLRSFDYA